MRKHIDSHLVKTRILLVLQIFLRKFCCLKYFLKFLFSFSYQIDLHKKDGKWGCVLKEKN
jgi:hypothetical protein